MWGRYLRRHDLFWTIPLALILALSIASATQLYRLASETLRGKNRTTFAWRETLKRGRTYTDIFATTVTATLLVIISLGAIYGIPPSLSGSHDSPRTWAPWAMALLHNPVFVDLRNEDISVKPSNWTGTKDAELDQVKGASLAAMNLRYASAQNAFLVKADLSSSDLEGADLSFADLRQAKLINTNLANANLAAANMQDALISKASMQRTTLKGANLMGAKFFLTNLEMADICEAEIKFADFRKAKGLSPRPLLVCSRNWDMAFYDEDMLIQLGLPADHNLALQMYQAIKSQDPFKSWQAKWREMKAETDNKPKAK